MLVLGRKEGESILIEGGIRIVVVSCDKGGVRLGIEAPSALRILRGEIAAQVASENQRASVPANSDWLASLGAAPEKQVREQMAADKPAPGNAFCRDSSV